MLVPGKAAVLLLTALILAACTAAGGGEASGNLPGSDQERASVSETDRAIQQPADETAPPGGSAATQIQTATFALG